MDDKDLSGIIGIIIAAAIITLAAYALVVAIPVGILLIIGFLLHWWLNKSPRARERKARDHTHRLYQKALALTPKMLEPTEFALEVLDRLPDTHIAVRISLGSLAAELYEAEYHTAELPPPPPICDSIEGGRYRDFLSDYCAKATQTIPPHVVRDVVAQSLTGFVVQLPRLPPEGESPLTVPLSSYLGNEAELVEALIFPFFDDKAKRFGLFKPLRKQLDANLQAISGPNKMIMPTDYKGNALEYLEGTPLLDAFLTEMPFALPEQARFEHCHIVGGTGQGKTTLLQHLILADLQTDKSVVVIDSQSDLIPKLARLKLDKKVILLDPVDNPTLNVFDINLSRYGDRREQVYNQTLEVFHYLFNSLLGADLTVRQSTLFNYIIALMLALPEALGRNATLLDLMKLMDDPVPYGPAIDALDPIARDFFRNDFSQKTYTQTKEQIRYRLQAILGNKTLARLFLAPENTFDFFDELNASTVILIDTNKDYLGAKNSSYLGKIAISLILNAILARAAISEKHPTLLYVDEAAAYFDKSIDTFLTEARKQHAGITIAHQYLSQMAPELRASVASDTAIKFAGGLSTMDAKALASDMRTNPDFLLSQPKLHFGCYVRDATPKAVSVTVPLGALDDEEKMSDEEWSTFRSRMRETYGGATPEPEPDPGDEPPQTADPDTVDTTPQ